MLIIVDYDSEGLREEASRIIKKLCEDEKKEFVDVNSLIDVKSTAIPSLEFVALKNLFDTEIPALEKDAVLDGFDLFSMIDRFDSFQQDFLFKQMNALGHATAKLVDELSDEDDEPFSFEFCVEKEFYVDFEKKLEPIVKKIEDSPLYKLLKSIDAYGYYVGSCNLDDPPNKIVVLPGGAGQKISFEEYANWAMKETPLPEIEENGMSCPDKEGEKIAYVRQHHTVEIIAKKIANKVK